MSKVTRPSGGEWAKTGGICSKSKTQNKIEVVLRKHDHEDHYWTIMKRNSVYRKTD
jgi:hypothetical protein